LMASLPQSQSSPDPTLSLKPSFIVGLGASAGGLEALESFFSNTPVDTGLAFVVVQHLSPDYKSLMVELLSKYTSLPVQEAQDNQRVVANQIYLIPRKYSLTIFHDTLHLSERHKPEHGLNLPIDIFLQSLAEDRGESAIAIILSGTGSDGARGVRAVKEAGGMVMVQDEQSARFDGMPRSAIATQVVDYVLSPEKMPEELVRFTGSDGHGRHFPAVPKLLTEEDRLHKIFALLRRTSGVDFSYYKRNTVVRRIERRMTINKYDQLSDYVEFLQDSPSEAHILRKEMLIGVTRFFRDPEAFTFLANVAIPDIIKHKSSHTKIRVWVAGCSTGEEAFSLAMTIHDCLQTAQRADLVVQVFATDIDEDALDFAGHGLYPESIAADVRPEWLNRYFEKRGDHYEVKRHIREMVIFAQQNLIKDPPFSKIDLISCRNVLIYFQQILQKRALDLFHFALNENGYLLLGTSENPSEECTWLEPISQKWRIYQRLGNTRPRLDSALALDQTPPTHNRPTPAIISLASERQQRREVELYRHLLEASLPPSVVVDSNLTLVHAFGDVSPYLSVPSGGRVTLDIGKMITAELSIPLTTAVHKVFRDDQEVAYRFVQIQLHGEPHTLHLIARPIFTNKLHEKLVMVFFEPVPPTLETDTDENTAVASDSNTYNPSQNASQRIRDLEHSLQFNKENLQATIEELETSNEELQATNEELLAANEELQSTNEELESVNEELITVNAEHQEKIRELTELNDDINNLFSSTDIGTIFLDNRLCIRKYTPAVQNEINLLPQDIGRPLSHIAHHFLHYDLVAEAEKVINTLVGHTREVRNAHGNWYLVKIFPYRTRDNIIKGVVISLVDITMLKRTNEKLNEITAALEESEERFRAALQFSGMAVYHQDPDLYYTWAYNPYSRFASLESEAIVGKTDYNIFLPEDANHLTQLKNQVLSTGLGIREEITVTIYGEQVIFDVTIEPRYNAKGELLGLTSAMLNITDRRSYAILNSLLNHAELGVFVKQPNGAYLFANQQFLRLLGLPPGTSLLNRQDADLLPEPTAVELHNLIETLQETGKPQKATLPTPETDFNLNLTLFEVRNSQNHLYGYCGLLTPTAKQTTDTFAD
ncbi:MAG: PAS domain-containing protein, partial [Anaerolineales bacterium]|nr:PAS domain-containing protein [Anaerolineales bacterium]